MHIDIMADTCKMVDTPNITVFTARESNECRLFTKKAFRKSTGINKSFQNSGEASIILRDKENEFAACSYSFLNTLKGFAAFPIKIGAYQIAGKITKREYFCVETFF